MDVKSLILGLQVGSQSAGGGGGSGESGGSGGSGGSTEDMISYDDMATGTTADVITLKNATSVRRYCFGKSNIKRISMPNVTAIGANAFDGCVSLQEVSMPKVESLDMYSFSDCSSLENPSFSECLTTIGSYAYRNCSSLKDITFPSTLETIGTYAFMNCKIKTVTFKSKPSSLNAKSFTNCTNLITINCPWAEGEVPDSPWGATKATIVYNHTGG